MNKRGWLIPIAIVAVNALAIICCWKSLPDPLPAHYDLQGSPDGVMQRGVLSIYPLIGAVICLAAYMIARIKSSLQSALIILTSGVCLVILSSSLVSLTFGKIPLFMLAEPVILLIAVAASVISILKSRKQNK